MERSVQTSPGVAVVFDMDGTITERNSLGARPSCAGLSQANTALLPSHPRDPCRLCGHEGTNGCPSRWGHYRAH